MGNKVPWWQKLIEFSWKRDQVNLLLVIISEAILILFLSLVIFLMK